MLKISLVLGGYLIHGGFMHQNIYSSLSVISGE